MKKLNIILGIIIIFTSCKTKVENNDCNENLSNQTGNNFEIYNEVFSDSTNCKGKSAEVHGSAVIMFPSYCHA